MLFLRQESMYASNLKNTRHASSCMCCDYGVHGPSMGLTLDGFVTHPCHLLKSSFWGFSRLSCNSKYDEYINLID
ncbi:hypothetical protein EFER_3534 [Escherichia fergusonii ATCC 35469]|uniref:Uncharacterized protein n=1 Tax=Escherichia fergusonii (strain ATCC 35469 / DSM 13698 / CCUG 18766 / IAM 14443 / JCM 21226 / LMG 7866 / NBRC 102419 / NCTC 12128 / CDC 0568-73) TaxID=585054 RepID=B7LTE8_ESCF3|nr:hypothetical protein EFER_3534 [Escherichia fergusonii ATCC 35469]